MSPRIDRPSRARRVPLVLGPLTLVLALAAPAASAASPTTTRVSVRSSGAQGDQGSRPSDISASGRFVAFESDAIDLVSGDTNGVTDVFVHDRGTKRTTRVSLRSNGTEGDLVSFDPSIL